MKVSWLTIKMLKNSGYIETSQPNAIVRQWVRSGNRPFPRAHIIKDNGWDVHIDLKEKHGKTFDFGNIETSGSLVKWELARIRKIHFEKEFNKLPQKSKNKKKLNQLINFYNPYKPR